MLSPPGSANMPRRRMSSVVFNDVVLLHGDQTPPQTTRNVCSSEKMTQTGDGNLWPEPEAHTIIIPSSNQVSYFYPPYATF